MQGDAHTNGSDRWSSGRALVWFASIAAAGLGVFLIFANARRSETAEALPYLLFLLCPLLHLVLRAGLQPLEPGSSEELRPATQAGEPGERPLGDVAPTVP